MEKMIENFQNHYIVCGIGEVGFHIVSELHATRRPNVIVDIDKCKVENALETFNDEVFI